MGFPESVLTSDEQVVAHLHPHWKAVFWPGVLGVLVIAGVAVAWAFLFGSWGQVPLLIISGVGLVIILVFTFWPWVKWRTTHYVFTNERVIMREGVFSRDGRDIPMGRINDVSFSHNLFERMLGCGTLTIESAGEHGQEVLPAMPHVERVQREIYEAVEAEATRPRAG